MCEEKPEALPGDGGGKIGDGKEGWAGGRGRVEGGSVGKGREAEREQEALWWVVPARSTGMGRGAGGGY